MAADTALDACVSFISTDYSRRLLTSILLRAKMKQTVNYQAGRYVTAKHEYIYDIVSVRLRQRATNDGQLCSASQSVATLAPPTTDSSAAQSDVPVNELAVSPTRKHVPLASIQLPATRCHAH